METASLFIQRVGLVLSGTTNHVTMRDARKAPQAKGRGRILIIRKSTRAAEMCPV